MLIFSMMGVFLVAPRTVIVADVWLDSSWCLAFRYVEIDRLERFYNFGFQGLNQIDIFASQSRAQVFRWRFELLLETAR
jgi:hypothetical protein